MTWSTKPLIPQNGEDETILTPDFQEILVGSPEDELLIYARGFTNWVLETKLSLGTWAVKVKNTAVWGLKSKLIGAWSLKNKQTGTWELKDKVDL